MKKFFLSLVVAMIGTTATFAQNTLVATLTHGDNISIYYGVNALREAHEAATSGDIINLSGGAFPAVDITKGITLRGAGIDAANPTYVNSNFTINIPEEETERILVEGIRFTETIQFIGRTSNAYFLKCQFSNVWIENESFDKNMTFVNCKITSQFSNRGTSSFQFVNSYVANVMFHNDNSSATFANCIIKPNIGYECHFIKNSQLFNCIIDHSVDYNNTNPPSTTQATNCVVVNYWNVFYESQANTGCVGDVSYEDMFKDYTGTYSDEQTFELTDEAMTKYLGTDGTQVGMYGGVMPYSSTPTYPQITKMNVANKTTADGKLSVEIEVSAAQ